MNYDELKLSNKEEITAGCGSIIKKSEGFICPYFSRPKEWQKEHGSRGCCQSNLQLVTNVCMCAYDYVPMTNERS